MPFPTPNVDIQWGYDFPSGLSASAVVIYSIKAAAPCRIYNLSIVPKFNDLGYLWAMIAKVAGGPNANQNGNVITQLTTAIPTFPPDLGLGSVQDLFIGDRTYAGTIIIGGKVISQPLVKLNLGLNVVLPTDDSAIFVDKDDILALVVYNSDVAQVRSFEAMITARRYPIPENRSPQPDILTHKLER